MYELNGTTYSLEEIEKAAEQSGMTLQEYIAASGMGFSEEGKKQREKIKIDDFDAGAELSTAGSKFWATMNDVGANLSEFPAFMNRLKFSITRGFLSDEMKETISKMDPVQQDAIAQSLGGVFASTYGMDPIGMLAKPGQEKAAELRKNAEKLRENLIKYDTDIYDTIFKEGNIGEGVTRLVTEAIGTAPTILQAMIPYVGIPSIVAGSAAEASREAVYEEGKDINIKQQLYSAGIGMSEGLLELVTKRIGMSAFKNIIGQPKEVVKKTLLETAGGIVKAGGAEGLSETGTLALNKFLESKYYNEKGLFEMDVTKWEEFWDEAGDTFLIGMATGKGMSGTGAAASYTRDAIGGRSVRKSLDKTNVSEVSSAFLNENVNEDVIELGRNQFASRALDIELNKKVKFNEISQEKADEIKKNFNNARQSIQLADNLKIGDKLINETVGLLQERNNLAARIKQAGENKALVKTDIERLNEIDNRLGDISVQNQLDIRNQKVTDILTGIESINIEIANNQQEADQIAKDKNLDKKASSERGFILQNTETGEQTIVINNDVALADKDVNVAAHELLHGVLFQTVKNSPETAQNLANALNEEINKIDTEALKDSDFKTRLDQYKNEPAEIQAEETLTLFADAIANGEIKYNETVFTKIGDVIRRLLQQAGLSNIKFNNSQDVFNFIKDYNNSIVKGELTKAQKQLTEKAAEGGLVSTPTNQQVNIKKSLATKVDSKKIEADFKSRLDQFTGTAEQRKYTSDAEFKKSNDFAQAALALEEDPAVLKKIEKEFLRYNVNPTTQNITDASRILSDKFMTTFNVEKNSLFGWALGKTPVLTKAVNTVIEKETSRPDAGAASIDQTFGEDQRGFDVVDDTDINDIIQNNIDGDKLRPRSKVGQKTMLNGEKLFDDNIVKAMKAKALEVLGKDYDITSDEFIKFVTDEFNTTIRPVLQKKIGNEAAYRKFIEENHQTDGDPFQEGNIPLADIVQMEKMEDNKVFTEEIQRNLKPKAVDAAVKANKLPKGTNRLSGPTLYKYGKPTVDDKVNFIYGVKGSKRGTRKDRTFLNLGLRAMFDMLVTQATETKVPQKQVTKLAAKVNVPQNIKFAKSVTKQVQEYGARTRARNEFQTINGKKLAKTDPAVKNKAKEEIIPSLKKLSKETRVLMLYTMQGTGKDKIDGTLGRSGMIFPNKQAAMDALGLTQQDIKNTDIKDAQNYAGKSVLSTSKLPIDLIKNLLTDGNLHLTIARENLAKETKLKQIVTELANLSAKNPDIAAGLNHIIGLQSDYQGHFIRKLVTFQSFTDPKLLSKGIHDEHYSKSLRTTRFVQSIIDKAATEGEDYLSQELNDDLENLVQGQARGIVSKIEGNKFDEKKGIGEQNHIAQTPFEEVYKKVQNPKKHYILPYTRLNPTSEVKTLQEVADNNFKRVKNFKYPNQLVKLSKSSNSDKILNDLNNYDKALRNAKDLKAPKKGISVFDFDDTLATTKSKIIVTMADGKVKEITPAEFAKLHSKLESEGATFDFSQFNEVIDGKPGPLAAKLKKAIDKFGNKDVFVLTARPAASEQAIYEFLKGIGLEIPLENITGLENGTPQAKANWVVDKAAQGYNDFYFTDDAYKNVKAVQDALEVLDVKSKSRVAYVDRVSKLDKDFNDILEAKTGIAAEKEYSPAKAKVVGAKKGRFTFFIPPSAEDFVGLLYNTLSKGKLGDNQMAWYKKNLLDPFARANANISRERIALMNDYKALKNQLNIVPKNLKKTIPGDTYTREQAVRVYIWDKQGMTVPGLSKADLKDLVKYVNGDAALKTFGDQLININKDDGYAAPTSGWLAGTTTTDLLQNIGTTKRAKHLAEWQQNVDIIFSEKNLNKMEAAFGKAHRIALEGILKRMKTGRNRSFQTDSLTGKVTDWLTNSIGTIMFFNTRSALLQTISAVNFINFKDNNIFKAGKAYANQKQYWSDFMTLMNSDFLVDRRRGLRINVNEADIANMAQESGPRGVISKMLEIGFLPTQIADSFAIASGGATMYRNRINTYKKQGFSQKEAEKKAFNDFREIAEESQQSSRPDRISAQQAGPLGRIILAFGNTPMQYARLIKKAASDLKNRRGDWKTNVSKIIYYGAVQNLIFNALQQAIFAIAFGDSDEDEEEKKYLSIANGMADSLLRGVGIAGAFVSVGKNAIIRIMNESEKPNPKYEKIGYELTRISPPISSKLSRLNQAARSLQWDKEEMMQKGLSYDNPAWLAGANVTSAITNVPVDRLVKKTTNVIDATSQDLEMWERLALLGGWQKWELDMTDDRKTKKSKKKKSSGPKRRF